MRFYELNVQTGRLNVFKKMEPTGKADDSDNLLNKVTKVVPLDAKLSHDYIKNFKDKH